MCAENGWEQFSLKCPHCLEFITTYPMIIMGLKNHAGGKDTKLFFCPSPGCTGFVEEDPDHKGLYGSTKNRIGMQKKLKKRESNDNVSINHSE